MSNRALLTVLAVIVFIAGLVYLLAPILTPFLVSALLAYMFDPLVDRLERWRLPRTLGVVVVFLVLAAALGALLFVLVPLVQHQIVNFAGKLPVYLDLMQASLLPWLEANFGLEPAAIGLDVLRQRTIEHWQELGPWLGAFFTYVTQSGLRVVFWLLNIVLIPVATFYLLRDWDDIVQRVHTLLPRRVQATAAHLGTEMNEVLASFLRGQLLVMLALATVYSAGLWLIGLELALPIGLAAGLLSFVPYLGFITGMLAAGTAAVLQFQDAWSVLWVLAVFGAGQALDATLLTPRLIGGRIGLHPVAVIFAVLAGGQLFGFFGVLLALPVAAAGLVWLRYLHAGYRHSAFYKRRSRK